MILHNSRDPHDRSPLGAQPTGERVTFRLRTDENPSEVWLRLWWDDREIRVPMKREAEGTHRASYKLPDHPGLLWYFFVLRMPDGGTRYYGNAADRLGGEGLAYDDEPPSFQLTVYDKTYDTPRWMREGVMYHIMVDRFHASRPASGRPAPERGHWHTNWYELPELNIDEHSADNMADDFFGGDLLGIEQKLPYLEDLGVTVLYLSPVFRSRSNHKYNTGDYRQIDPSFGTERDFRSLCEAARQRGMRVMLDGVFSHTGSDSRYFNRQGSYDSVGAYQSQGSPYASWYRFTRWPDEYESWWGFDTLPCVNKMDPGYLDFVIRGQDPVISHWLSAGGSGWRLDVADELPMEFLRMLRARVKQSSRDGAVLGEVWEDASCKIAYDELRCYCLGDTLDSVMNYPLREALIDFFLGRATAGEFARRIEQLHENYPKPFFYSLMNLLGSHDKARALSILSGAGEMEPRRRDRRPVQLKPADYNRGKERLILAWQLISALPGMPALYYADEAGAEGMADPFCRGTYPWGREDVALLQSIRGITRARREHPVWALGAMRILAPTDDVLVVVRSIEGGKDAFGESAEDATALCAINRGAKVATVTAMGVELTVPAMGSTIRLSTESLG